MRSGKNGNSQQDDGGKHFKELVDMQAKYKYRCYMKRQRVPVSNYKKS